MSDVSPLMILKYHKLNALCGASIVGILLVFMASGDISAHINEENIQATLTPQVVIAWLLLLCAFTINLTSHPSMALVDCPGRSLLVISFFIDMMIISFIVGVPIVLTILIAEYFQVGHFAWSIDRAPRPGGDNLFSISALFVAVGWSLLGLHLYFSKQTIGGTATNTFIKLNEHDSLLRCIVYGPAVFFSIGTLLLPEYASKKLEATAYKTSQNGLSIPQQTTKK